MVDKVALEEAPVTASISASRFVLERPFPVCLGATQVHVKTREVSCTRELNMKPTTFC